VSVERPQKFGGNVSFSEYAELEAAFAKKELHPTDLKQTVAELLVPIVSTLAGHLSLEHDLSEIIKNSV